MWRILPTLGNNNQSMAKRQRRYKLKPQLACAVRDAAICGDSVERTAERCRVSYRALHLAWHSPEGEQIRASVQRDMVDAYVRHLLAVSMPLQAAIPKEERSRRRRKAG